MVVGDPVAAGVIAEPLYVFLKILQNAGDPIFAALGLIFAIGVALGMAKNDGVSALAATVGYLVMTATIGVVADARGIETKAVLGLQTLDTGVFGGIIIGIIAGVPVQPVLPNIAAAVSRLLRRQAVRADRHRVRRHRPGHRAGLRLAADRELHREHRQRGHQRQRAGRGVRLRAGRTRAAALRPAPHLERAVLLRRSTSAAGPTATAS